MLRFSLTDYTTCNDCAPVVIEEPVGWDAITMRLKRDKTWHGFFDFFDDSLTGLQFDNASYPSLGNGYAILRAAYGREGSEARVDLLIEFMCSDTDEYEVLYTGRCVFSRYKDVCGDRCYVEVGIETTSCIMVFKNRYDQKVDLDSLTPFDEPQCQCRETVEVTGSFVDGVDGYGIVINTADGHEIGDLVCIKVGDTITITNSDSNNGTYTVVDFIPSDLAVLITVEEPVADETDSTFTITGCLFREAAIVLEQYSGLNKQILLPPKIIQFKNDWGVTPGVFEYVDEFGTGTAIAETRFYFIPFDWDIERITEIRDSDATRAIFAELGSAPGVPIENFRLQNDGIVELNISNDIKCVGEAAIHIDMEGEIEIDSADTMQFDGVIQLIYGNDADGYTVVNLQSGFGCLGCNNSTNAISINFDDTISLKDGDRVYILFTIGNFQYTTGGGGGGPTDPFTLTMTLDSANVKITIDTQCESTSVKVYLVNEVMSRITEAYTNDCLRVYSDYFGRTDAQPYTSEGDGCGSLEVITSGLKIRAKNDLVPIGDTMIQPRVTVSMKEMFDAMNAVHNIGMSIEEDSNRPGEELIRIEPMNHFYNTDILMECDHIKQVTREIVPAELYAIAKTGYAKWETENVNGLNDVFGRREYRTLLKSIKNTYDRVCKFIASDYAIEITRRLYGGTTKDWRYDNDFFIICLRGYLKGAVQFIENGGVYTIILFQVMADNLEVGDQLVITGSTSNDGTYTIASIVAINESGTEVTVVESVTDEFVPTGAEASSPDKILYNVETNNVASSDNILHPDNCYNLRITPARNAMRHFKTILSNYRVAAEGKLKFTNGDGNYIAELQLDADDCLNEIDALLAENTDIDLTLFQDPDANLPLFWPERVKFDYPVTWQQYKAIRANPCGQIKYQCGDGEWEYGWIDDFQLKPTGPRGGLATFILKPKIEV